MVRLQSGAVDLMEVIAVDNSSDIPTCHRPIKLDLEGARSRGLYSVAYQAALYRRYNWFRHMLTSTSLVVGLGLLVEEEPF